MDLVTDSFHRAITDILFHFKDTWDAMTSDRVYRKAMKKEQALQVLEQERDSGQWDPYLVDQFVALLRKNNLYELPAVEIAA